MVNTTANTSAGVFLLAALRTAAQNAASSTGYVYSSNVSIVNDIYKALQELKDTVALKNADAIKELWL